MKQIRVFTEDYQDILEQRLPTAVRYGFDDMVAGLADVAAQIMGKGDQHALQAEFRDFLQENEYIHLDAFIRICLEDAYA